MISFRMALVVVLVFGYLTIRIAQTQEGYFVLRNIHQRPDAQSEKGSKGSIHVEIDIDDDYEVDEEPNRHIGEKNSSSVRIPESEPDVAPEEPEETNRSDLLSPDDERLELPSDLSNDAEYVRNSNGSRSFNPKADLDYYNFTDDKLVPDFYNDKFDTYDCRARFRVPGSHPRFMVLGVHKGGSTGLYNYLAKHGRIRPAVCKEIHFFDEEEQYARGKSYYLRHFPDVSMHKGKVITGEGSPDYLRVPEVPPRVKAMFPGGGKFLMTLREPATRFVSHWVGKKDLHIPPFSLMTCEQAWNTSAIAVDRCLEKSSLLQCSRKLHENAVMRGIYLPQIQQWLKFFPVEQFFVIQAEAMFHNTSHILQQAAKFLAIRPYSDAELESLHRAKLGSAHLEEPLAKECDHIVGRMNAYYARFNALLIEFFKVSFPHVFSEWQPGWSGI